MLYFRKSWILKVSDILNVVDVPWRKSRKKSTMPAIWDNVSDGSNLILDIPEFPNFMIAECKTSRGQTLCHKPA